MSCCSRPPVAQAAQNVPADDVLPWWRLLTGAVLAGNMMAFSLAANVGDVEPAARFGLQLGLLAATALIALLLARPLRLRLAALWRARRLDVEAMFAIGMAGALAYSLHSTFVSPGPVYYEVVGILLALYALSQRLKRAAQSEVERHLAEASLRDVPAWVEDADGGLREVPAREVRAGMRVRVLAGRPIVVDGTVVRGEATVQTLSLTGEPFARRIAVGDRVRASWHCLDAALLVRADVAGDAREVDRIGALVVAAHDSGTDARGPGAKAARSLGLTQQLAAWFAPAVMLVAALTFFAWAAVGPLERAWLNALAVALVACPCALGFAVPLALRVGVLRLASMGCQVRSVASVERLAEVRRVAFDKTGTLTTLSLEAADVHVLPAAAGDARPLSPAALLALVQAAQAHVDHPVAEAFGRIQATVPSPWTLRAVRVLPGAGIEAEGADEAGSHRLRVGPPDAAAAPVAARLVPTGKALAIAVDGRLAAIARLDERPRAAPAALFAALERRGLAVSVLSGDGAERVARLGLASAEGGLGAAGKRDRVAAWQAAGEPVCVVGDGFNDAAAMAAAHASVSLAGASAVATELADLSLPPAALSRLPEAFDVSQQSLTAARRAVVLSVAYNAIGMAVAAAGWLEPVFAALLMLASSLSVSALSARLWQAGEGRAAAPAEESCGLIARHEGERARPTPSA